MLQNQPSDVESLDALRAFIEVYEHIKGEYVEEIDDQTLLNDAINGMLTKLDPHSGYLKPRDVSSLPRLNLRFLWRDWHRNGRRERLD
jgi:carboxyl-terminal processing protease